VECGRGLSSCSNGFDELASEITRRRHEAPPSSCSPRTCPFAARRSSRPRGHRLPVDDDPPTRCSAADTRWPARSPSTTSRYVPSPQFRVGGQGTRRLHDRPFRDRRHRGNWPCAPSQEQPKDQALQKRIAALVRGPGGTAGDFFLAQQCLDLAQDPCDPRHYPLGRPSRTTTPTYLRPVRGGRVLGPLVSYKHPDPQGALGAVPRCAEETGAVPSGLARDRVRREESEVLEHIAWYLHADWPAGTSTRPTSGEGRDRTAKHRLSKRRRQRPAVAGRSSTFSNQGRDLRFPAGNDPGLFVRARYIFSRLCDESSPFASGIKCLGPGATSPAPTIARPDRRVPPVLSSTHGPCSGLRPEQGIL